MFKNKKSIFLLVIVVIVANVLNTVVSQMGLSHIINGMVIGLACAICYGIGERNNARLVQRNS